MAHTYQIDLQALARHHHATTPQSLRNVRGASVGFGLAPSITGYEIHPLHPLVDKTSAAHGVAMVKVDQPWANYSLVDDAGGRFKFLTEDGRVIVDEEGFAYIVGTGFMVELAETAITVMVGVQIGVTTVQYPYTLVIAAAPEG
ncbi:hypothetical protein MARCHEWKA_00450 [Brevundimonas phage vB_BpoS-Marchewka]|uniref:Uncharacterized protein n=1 Tax=Brevundimonas phage vB_BpoS-Marchewka TaxID=2948604 RepID=A0A9E7N4B4_9CAUD|nr:hypothetical protein MARCHEWKA_00450 [Brevundimonas phage vB_BpoS-Marchewka]